ncbi:MAG: exopolyphosphatase / guanosine-5-triphosphate,3-diphosphate pyrophosphatase [Thermoleophilaceae bacterium]|nr:exopolyphosphatase / guanosine-5-triphosphate,3-diphosphate pyrophosphatase [Thermoleophilaceae bacterium]
MARIAVVDLGTNTTRLLVADVDGGRLRELDRRSEVTRLGEGVDASGRLADAAMERVLAVVATYRRAIDDLEAERTVAVATSAVRDAANADAFRARLRDELGVEARTISGGEEARLTFLGATHGRRPDEQVLVVDIGGGSTEFVVGHPGSDPSFHVSTQAGSVRQTERHLASDPPDPDEVASLAEEVQAIVTRDVPEDVRAAITRGIAVAGTATALAAIDQKIDDSERVDGYQLELAACEQMLALLASLDLERRREVTGLHPDRAPTIVAGAVILVEAMRACGLESMETSEADILHGAALIAAAAMSAD